MSLNCGRAGARGISGSEAGAGVGTRPFLKDWADSKPATGAYPRDRGAASSPEEAGGRSLGCQGGVCLGAPTDPGFGAWGEAGTVCGDWIRGPAGADRAGSGGHEAPRAALVSTGLSNSSLGVASLAVVGWAHGASKAGGEEGARSG